MLINKYGKIEILFVHTEVDHVHHFLEHLFKIKVRKGKFKFVCLYF